jgi:hypothetical protein
VRDSAGIQIVENVGPSWTETSAWSVAAEPQYVIGGATDDPAYQLWNVTGMARLSDGRTVILNAGTRQLRFYDERGRHVRDRAGEGDGPGELRAARRLVRTLGDSLLVLDRWTIHVFDSEGEFLDKKAIPYNFSRDPSQSFAGPMDILSNGNVLAFVNAPTSGTPTPGVLYRPRLGVAMYLSDIDSLVNLTWTGGAEQEYLEVGRFPHNYIPPHARDASFVGGGVVPIAVLADNASYEFHVYSGAGDLIRIVRREWLARPAQPEWFDIWKEEQRNAEWTRGQLPDLERAWAAMTLPTTLPAYNRPTVATDGSVWMLESTAPGETDVTYAVFAADGRMMGLVALPPGLEKNSIRPPYIDAEFFIGVWIDEVGREEVRAYRILKGS